MIKTSYLLSFFVLMLLGACINQKKNKTDISNQSKDVTAALKVDPYDEGVSFDELMDSVSFVKLLGWTHRRR